MVLDVGTTEGYRWHSDRREKCPCGEDTPPPWHPGRHCPPPPLGRGVVGRTSVCTEPGCPVLTSGGRCPAHSKQRVQQDRPTTTQQGYGARWRAVRDPFIAAHPVCQGDGIVPGQHHPNCDGRATVADHDPVTRRVLVARGDPNPDACRHLVARSAACHGRKSVLFDGAFGKPLKKRLDTGCQEKDSA